MKKCAFLICAVALLLSRPSAFASVSFTWLGTTGIFLTDGSSSLLFDPVATRPTLSDEVFNREIQTDRAKVMSTISELQIKNVTGVFVSHSHFDHSLDSPEFSRQTGATLYGSESTANIGRGDGLPEDQIHVFNAGEKLQVGNFRVTVIDAIHPPLVCGHQTAAGNIEQPLSQPAPIHDFKMGGAFSFLIEHPEGRIFFHPTSRAGVREVQPKADALFIGIASRRSDRDVIEQFVRPTMTATVIPIHFDDFFSPVSENGDTKLLTGIDLDGFLKSVKKSTPWVKPVVPEYGKSITVF